MWHIANKKRLFFQSGAVLALLCTAPFAQADAGDTQGGVSVNYGVGNDYRRTTLNFETPTLWSYALGGGGGRLDLTGEAGVSYWQAKGSRSPGTVWQLSAIPMFRWWTGERFYIEAGIGATAFTSTNFADKQLGSAFQFGDHIGLGFLLAPQSRLGLRYSHFSNFGLKQPNAGLNVTQVTYTHQF